jgi:hypothetical protein
MTQSVFREIDGYTIVYYGGGKKIAKPYPYRAIIGLYDDKSLIGALYFHNDPNTMPDADSLPDAGQPMVHFPIEDFHRILDILRNEKPVYYQQFSNCPTMAGLRINREPVGEGELV